MRPLELKILDFTRGAMIYTPNNCFRLQLYVSLDDELRSQCNKLKTEICTVPWYRSGLARIGRSAPLAYSCTSYLHVLRLLGLLGPAGLSSPRHLNRGLGHDPRA